jgi:hypothetical protein
MGSTCLEWAEYKPVWPYLGRVRHNYGAKSFHRPYPVRVGITCDMPVFRYLIDL